MSFKEFINTSLNEAIKYHKKNGIPLDSFMNIEVHKNDRIMDEKRGEYKIDWDNLTILIYNCNIHQDYRLIITVFTKYLNDLLDDIIHYSDEK